MFLTMAVQHQIYSLYRNVQIYKICKLLLNLHTLISCNSLVTRLTMLSCINVSDQLNTNSILVSFPLNATHTHLNGEKQKSEAGQHEKHLNPDTKQINVNSAQTHTSSPGD
ncbi:hypothetical protein TSAR_001506, partial [Trichomalopsis sarcophagae]